MRHSKVVNCHFCLISTEKSLISYHLSKMSNKGISEIPLYDPNLPKMDCSLFEVTTVMKKMILTFGSKFCCTTSFTAHVKKVSISAVSINALQLYLAFSFDCIILRIGLNVLPKYYQKSLIRPIFNNMRGSRIWRS